MTAVKRAETAWQAAVAAAERNPNSHRLFIAEQQAGEVYTEVCHDAGVCQQRGCDSSTQWCSYCDTHCENPDHVPHDHTLLRNKP